jgi:hypothetical protein
VGPDGLRAECSHCDYSRRFSPELGGRYFRCPKCRQGVLAVPRASTEEQQRWRSSEERWLVPSKGEAAKDAAPAAGGDPSETPDGIVALGRAAAKAGEPDAATPGRRRSSQRTPKAAKAAAAATKTDLAPIPAPSSDGSAEALAAPSPTTSKETTSSVDAASGSGSEDPAHKGEVGTVRRIMVECGLCGFLVGIPPAFFGKTVHCPECAGDTVFSESTLEPVKDELVDRMALETAERDVLFRLDGPRESRWTTLRSFLVGVALGLLAIVGIWGFVASRNSAYRDAAVDNAVRGGWRYATNEDDPNLLHEPWCRSLGPRVAAKFSEEERAARPALTLHDCD